MKYISTFLIITFLSLFCAATSAQENPFMEMVGKKYAEYCNDLRHQYIVLINHQDTVEARKMVYQIEEIARRTGSAEWKFYATYFDLEMFTLKWLLNKTRPAPGLEEAQEKKLKLLEEAEKANLIHVELMIRHRIIEHYWDWEHYELAFEQGAIQTKRLEKVSIDDVPLKLRYLIKIADMYYQFKDYTQAVYCYERMLEEKDLGVHTRYSKHHARNGLGLSYRDYYNDLGRSDSCFRLILDADSVDEIWTAIAEGNLGHNMVMRGEYDAAIPLLKNSFDTTLYYGDYGFTIGTGVNLATAYLKKGNFSEAKRYIELAQDYYHNKNRRARMLQRIYEFWCKYYATTGDIQRSVLYMDSTLAASKGNEEKFSALLMMRAEQRQHLSEQKQKEEELYAEKIKSDGFKRSLTITFVALLLIGGVLIRYYILYRKKQAAYRELVRKSQEWAHVIPPDNEFESFGFRVSSLKVSEFNGLNSPFGVASRYVAPETLETRNLETRNLETRNLETRNPETGEASETGEAPKPNGMPDEFDRSMMTDIEKLMSEEHLYRDPTLSVDLLAQKIGAKRHYVSNAINLCTDKSFNTFVNEYRIKEAIQLLSKTDAPTIDMIAFETGFNDRQNFYRVFKKMTGLSPTEFRFAARVEGLKV